MKTKSKFPINQIQCCTDEIHEKLNQKKGHNLLFVFSGQGNYNHHIMTKCVRRRVGCFVWLQVDKVVQMYETMLTRHTTMIVGPTGGGKSVVINTLCQSQTK